MKTLMKFIIIVLSLVLMLHSCTEDCEIIEGYFSTSPINFESINSEYDDFNSSYGYLNQEFTYIFSSNRNTQGEEFDIINFYAKYYFDQTSNRAYFTASNMNNNYYNDAFNKINTSYNEYGPLSLFSEDYLYEIFFYASDSNDNLDIKYITQYAWDSSWGDPTPLDKLNTEYNEAYPTFTRYFNEMFFCSDKNGNYDLFYVEVSRSIINWLETEELPVWNTFENLNSSSNDKCPYINGNLMIFVSDREGGFGGFDLYYSIYNNGIWSDPINFGEDINTEYDEYRPISIYLDNYINDVMLFSSNRPGGLGGFDLYYVGIPKMML